MGLGAEPSQANSSTHRVSCHPTVTWPDGSDYSFPRPRNCPPEPRCPHWLVLTVKPLPPPQAHSRPFRGLPEAEASLGRLQAVLPERGRGASPGVLFGVREGEALEPTGDPAQTQAERFTPQLLLHSLNWPL